MKLIASAALILLASSVSAQTHVSGYTTKRGTYVAPAVRSNANNTQKDNYSSKGNVNPYTGKIGTKTPKY